MKLFNRRENAKDTNRYSPNFLSYAQYSIPIKNRIMCIFPNSVQLMKNWSKKPPEASRNPCKNNKNTFVKIQITSLLLYIIHNF